VEQVQAAQEARPAAWKWVSLGAPRGTTPRLPAAMGYTLYPPRPAPASHDGLPRSLIKEAEVAVLCDTPAATTSLLGTVPAREEGGDVVSWCEEDAHPLYVMFLAEGGGSIAVLQRIGPGCRRREGGEEAQCSGADCKGRSKSKKDRGGGKKAGKKGEGRSGKRGEWRWVLLIDTPERGRAQATFDDDLACASSVSLAAARPTDRAL
jgi:hypothetical protein